MKTLCKIDRFMAWVLLFGMTLFFVTGYGMTKGIIDSTLAVDLHNKYLPIIIIIAFVFHAGYATRLAFIRWRWWGWPMKTVWLLFFLSFLIGFIYIDQWYEQSYETLDVSNNSSIVDEDDSEAATDKTVNETSTIKVFDAEELAKYDGQDGSPAYVAVNGKVYDLTSVFEDGKHYSHYAGKELTNAFFSYHVSSALSKYPIVGEFIN